MQITPHTVGRASRAADLRWSTPTAPALSLAECSTTSTHLRSLWARALATSRPNSPLLFTPRTSSLMAWRCGHHAALSLSLRPTWATTQHYGSSSLQHTNIDTLYSTTLSTKALSSGSAISLVSRVQRQVLHLCHSTPSRAMLCSSRLRHRALGVLSNHLFRWPTAPLDARYWRATDTTRSGSQDLIPSTSPTTTS